jgi:hypothetical protein
LPQCLMATWIPLWKGSCAGAVQTLIHKLDFGFEA